MGKPNSLAVSAAEKMGLSGTVTPSSGAAQNEPGGGGAGGI